MSARPSEAPPALPFVKMEGAGNDFVVVVAADLERALGPSVDRLPAGVVVRLCDRRLGVGADGVVVLEAHGGPAFAVRYRNRDGSDAFCGNGTRCAAAYAHALLGAPSTLVLETAAGPLEAVVESVSGDRSVVRVAMPVPGPVRDVSLEDVESGLTAKHVVVGVPHLVLFVDDVARAPIERLGPRLRRHAAAGPDGANVDFVESRGRTELLLRTFERGVEGETLACGSGAVAAAAVVSAGKTRYAADVKVRSGDVLRVVRDARGHWLSGPARVVYRGAIEISSSGSCSRGGRGGS